MPLIPPSRSPGPRSCGRTARRRRPPWPAYDRRSAPELLGGALGGVGEVQVLQQAPPGDEGDQPPVLIHDRELALLALPQDAVGLAEGDPLRRGDELGGHDLVERAAPVLLEV